MISRKLIIGVIFIAAAAVTYFNFTTRAADYHKARVDEQAAQAKLDQSKKYLASLKSAQAIAQEKAQSLQYLDLAVPASDTGLPEYLVQMDTIAANSGVAIDSMQLSLTGQQVQADQKYGSLPVAFSVSGNFSQIDNFLGLLHSSLRVIEVKSINFSTSDTGTVKANIAAGALYATE